METYRKDSDYVVWVDLPGVDPKDVHVEAVTDGLFKGMAQSRLRYRLSQIKNEPARTLDLTTSLC
jgi:HSP20 family molecular chaperone IbpA